jgi:guanine deaminase
MKKWMQEAIDSAKEGVDARHGGPFGACVVKEGKLIAVGHNTVLRDHDPTCHAEMNAIRAAAKKLGTHVLDDCELYTTAEPCPMCLSAILWARIPHVKVGVPREVAAKYGFDDAFFYEQVALDPEEREIETEFSVMEPECEEVFAQWKSLEGQIY